MRNIIITTILIFCFFQANSQVVYKTYYCETPLLYLESTDTMLPSNSAMYILFLFRESDNKGLIVSARDDDESEMQFPIIDYLGKTPQGDLYELVTKEGSPEPDTAEFYYDEQGNYTLKITRKNSIFLYSTLVGVED